MARKSPYRHPVRSYIREGNRVDKYMRGEGKAPRVAPIGAGSIGGARWRVSRGGERVNVSAGNIDSALARGVDSLRSTAETVTVNRV